jgi:hypothetical protein
MTTIQYYSSKGKLTIFPNHTITNGGIVSNTKTGNMMTRHEDVSGYYRVTIYHEGQSRTISVARALASTFLGPPPTLHHTAEHKDRNRGHDTLDNIIWEDKSGQRQNQKRPTEYSNAFIIVRHGIEHTAKEWTEVYKGPDDKKYATTTIIRYAQQHRHGFYYKTFPNLRSEVWKAIPGAKNSKGEWFISSRSRMKYKTAHAENVLTTYQLCKNRGYPVVGINGKVLFCHVLSLMTFRPNEYAARTPGDIILHKKDDKLNFNPFRLRWGTETDNRIDAHNNGKYYAVETLL